MTSIGEIATSVREGPEGRRWPVPDALQSARSPVILRRKRMLRDQNPHPGESDELDREEREAYGDRCI